MLLRTAYVLTMQMLYHIFYGICKAYSEAMQKLF